MKKGLGPIFGLLVIVLAGATSCRASGAGPAPASSGPSAETSAAPSGSPTEASTSQATTPPLVQPGAPGTPSRVITAEEASDLSGIRATPADVAFMQGMIHHHHQALEMTALVPDRTERESMRLLALRIDLSQQDEIGMMERWLEVRDEAVPPPDRRGTGAMQMPGMLTADEMRRLQEASGDEFDRLFLEGMIKHHGGALIMVDNLFATAGAGQEPTINAFASEVVADQRAEMDRMAAMLSVISREQPR